MRTTSLKRGFLRGSEFAAPLALALLVSMSAPAPGTADPRPSADPKELPPSYRLEMNEVLRWMPAPFPPERAAWLRAAYPQAFGSLLIRWNRTPLAGDINWHSGPTWTLGDVCRFTLNLYPHEIEADAGALKTEIPEGDLIVDDQAPQDRIAAALEDLCRNQLMLRLRLSLKVLERNAVVVRGEFHREPGAKPDASIELADDASRLSALHGAGVQPFDTFLKAVGLYLGRPVVSEVKRPPKELIHYVIRRWSNLGEEPPAADVASTLKRLAAQTGLTFTEEARRVPVLRITRD